MPTLTKRLVSLGLAALFLAACNPAAKAPSNTTSTASVGAPDGIGYVKGVDTAPVTLIEYASPTCPACKYFHTEINPKLMTNYVDTGKVKLVYRPFAIHEPDVPAYVLAMCAGEDKFLTVIDDMFKNQEGIIAAASSGGLEAALKTIGARHGIATDAQFKACLDNKAYYDALGAATEAARKDRVTGTPTFVMNGEVLTFENGLNTYEGLARELDKRLGATTP